MDKYVIDLDKVLDELELNDDYDESAVNNRNHVHESDDSANLINDRIDLNDADFSIHSKPPKLLIASSSSSLSNSMVASNNNVLVEQNNNIETLNKSVGNQNKFSMANNLNCCQTNDDNVKNDFSVANNDDLSVIEHNDDDDDDGSKAINSEKILHTDQVLNDQEQDALLQIVDDQNSEPHSDCPINEKLVCDNECLVTTENVSDEDKIINSADDLSGNQEKIVTVVAELKPESIETSDTTNENFNKQIDSSEKVDDKDQNDLDEIAIGAMSEEDLDRYLGDLNDDLDDIDANSDIQTDSQQLEPDQSNKVEQLVQQEIKVSEIKESLPTNDSTDGDSQPVSSSELVDAKSEPVNSNDEDNDENEYWSQKLGLNDDDKDENGANNDEQAQQLQELEEILSDSSEQQQQKQSQPTTSSENGSSNNDLNENRTNETRGGLVQNINYFERQEMPNGLTEEEQMLGKVKPFWIPDEDAQNCLHCDVRFTLIKRRHHCRSCGKVLCSQCCNFKARLPYLDYKEARVCQLCYAILMKIEEIERINGRQLDISNHNDSTVNDSPDHPPDPNNPSEYCSTISPLEQVSEAVNMPPPTVMVPIVIIIDDQIIHPESSNSESTTTTTVKQVMFSDGVRPGGDLVEQPATSSNSNTSSNMDGQKPVITRTQLQLKSPLAEKILVPFENFSKPELWLLIRLHGQSLPPIINYYELKSANPSLPSKPNYSQLIEILRDPQTPWITFGLTKNLHISTKIISKTCCNSQECWSFSSKGLASVGQDEIICVIDCQSLRRSTTTTTINDGQTSSQNTTATNSKHNNATTATQSLEHGDVLEFPRDVFRMYTTLYDSASTANLYMDLMHIFFPDGLFNNKENSGFIFTRPTMQCLRNIHLPPPPFLIAILIHKWEIPWAKIFPLRLVLRLGYEYKMYPSPVISYANRKSAYFEIGHTIMNVLADFRNFHYTLSVVKDLFICVEQRKRVTLFVPKLSYEKVCKVLSTSNEHVLAFGGNLSLRADSHFVCLQNEDDDDIHSQYRTELSSYPGSQEKLTGASFIVFSGVLKSSTGLKAKMNIVEDGLLVQIPPSLMEEFRSAIKDMKDFRIDCCKVTDTNSNPDESIQLKWVNDELSTNLGVRSQIDGLNLEGVQSARIFSNPDYANDRYLIRWIEVFLLQINDNGRRSEMINANKLAETVSQAFCVALIDYLDQLYENGLTKISLRISLDIDKVGYETGSGGKPLPPQITQPLDNALIPVIMGNISTTGIEDPLVIELLFFVLLK
ncbi:Zinc finger FYVE domain-containing protein 9 [Dermatophagoides farinae]|uniref:Zinc finger FYVE domain-containing protein 9 n=1 Tax=Dermatophagoides farinae TaxID=6954 RepID=A0A922HVA9_DERFA|nr:Zinc finger FYVE domain-containing protein 9 [Dermatophagoides farinae]